MPLSEADFYAYSRATGTPVPRDAQERAEIAPQVLGFRQGQLSATKEELDRGNFIDMAGKTALVAGLGAGAAALATGGRFGKLRDALANVIRPKDVGATTGVRTVDLNKTNIPVEKVSVQDVTPSAPGTRTAPRARTTDIPIQKVSVQDVTASVPTTRTGSFGDIYQDLSSTVEVSPSRLLLEAETEAGRKQRIIQEALSRDLRGTGTSADLQFSPTRSFDPPDERMGQLFKSLEEEGPLYIPEPSERELARAIPFDRPVKLKEEAYSAAVQRRPISSVAEQEYIPGIQDQSQSKEVYLSQSQQQRQDLENLRASRGDTQLELKGPEFKSNISQLLKDSEQEAIFPVQNLYKTTSSQAAIDFSPRSYLESTGAVAPAPSSVLRKGRDPVDVLLDEREAAEIRRIRQADRAQEAKVIGKGERLLAELQAETLVEKQNARRPLVSEQSVEAVDTGADQQTARVMQGLQRNEDLDLSQIEIMEDMARQSYYEGRSQPAPQEFADAAINPVAASLPDGLPIDQAEGAWKYTRLASTRSVPARYKYQIQPEYSQGRYDKVTGLEHEKNLRAYMERREREQYAKDYEELLGSKYQGPVSSTTVPDDLDTPEGIHTVSNLKDINPIPEPLEAGAEYLVNLEPLDKAASKTSIRGASKVAREDLAPRPREQPYIEGRRILEPTEEPNFGSLGGVGVYGLERAYAPGAIKKAGEYGTPEYGTLGYEYSKAAYRKPTDPSYGESEKKRSKFSALSDQQIQNFVEGATQKGNTRAAAAASKELERRASFDASRELRALQVEANQGNPRAQAQLKSFIQNMRG
jgi:hypothetical protein